MTSDFAVERKWSEPCCVDVAVGLGFDFLFFLDATQAEIGAKMHRFLRIVNDIRRWF